MGGIVRLALDRVNGEFTIASARVNRRALAERIFIASSKTVVIALIVDNDIGRNAVELIVGIVSANRQITTNNRNNGTKVQTVALKAFIEGSRRFEERIIITPPKRSVPLMVRLVRCWKY